MQSLILLERPHRTAQGAVADQLRRAILAGELPPGSRLLQATIAEQLGTSTTPVREALRELGGEGLVDLDPHRGVVVHEPSIGELQEVYRIRLVLEPVAIAATVEKITDDQLAKTSRILDEMDRDVGVAQWAILNASFHAELAKATQLPILTSLLVKLRNLSTLYIASLMSRRPEIVVQAQEEHRALIEACRRRDVDAAREVEVAHLRHTLVVSQGEQVGFAPPSAVEQ